MRVRAVALAISVAGVLIVSCQDPPLSTQQKARYAVDQASEAGSLRYAPVLFRQAEDILTNGQMEMARQNGRLAPFRDYRVADSLFNLAFTLASEAADSTRSRIQNLKSTSIAEKNALKQELSNFRESLDGNLTLFHAERHWTSADLAVSMSEKLIQQGEFYDALATLSEGRRALDRVRDILDEYSESESQSLATWRHWVDATVSASRAKGSVCIVVDKTAHRLYLVRAGRVVHSYDCELGYNSARQKYFAGDGATPEGTYSVTKVRHNGSKYYKALMLNYPNSTDQQRFKQNKTKGVISRYARIGGLIEIHGNGGRSKDWTDGCVALTDKEMEHLMQYVSVGTPVTIVRKSDRWP
jgi:hypothetical protein